MIFSALVEFIKTQEKKNALHVAIAYILIAYIFHSIQITFYQMGHFTVVPQSTFLRSFISIIMIFPFQSNANYYPKNQMKHLIKSQFIIATGSPFYFYGLNFISLSQAAILFATNSIWSQLMVSFMNKERITRSRFINSIICIFGIVLIVNPKIQTQDQIMNIIGCVCILICSVLQSYGFIIMKQIGKDVPSTVTTFYLHIMIVFTTSLQQQFIGKFEYFDGYFFYIIGFTVFTMCAHLLQFRAQTMVTYDKLCNYTYSQMIYIIIIDYIVFRKILPINGFIGGACILFGVFKQLSEDKQLKG